MKPVPAIVSPIADHAKLAKLESQIDQLEATYIDVGRALDAMKRLFSRSDHFEAHCRKLWGWSTSTVYEKIQAATIAISLQTFGILPPSKETAMQLAGLEPADQKRVWKEVVNSARGRITAAHVAKVVEKLLGKPVGAGPGEVAPQTIADLPGLSPEEKKLLLEETAKDARRPSANGNTKQNAKEELIAGIVKHLRLAVELAESLGNDYAHHAGAIGAVKTRWERLS